MGVSINTEVRNVNPTKTDSSDIASAFNKTAKADILRNFADSFQALNTQTILFNNQRLERMRSLSEHLFPAGLM